jgi:CelD/BcsL family acetyltransferase involved in cellulose biosynthesis
MLDRIEWITEPGRLEAMANRWDLLVTERHLPYGRPAWYSAWWAAFGTGDLTVATAWRGDELTGVLPLHQPASHLLESMTNVHTPVFRPVVRDGRALEALLSAALDAAQGSIALAALPEDDVTVDLLRATADDAGWHSLIEREHVSPIVELEGDFAAWRKRTRRQWRTPIERFRRKMLREHDAQLVLVEQPVDLERELDEGFAVEASGWKGRQGTAITSAEDTEAFYRGVARAFHARGELRLSRIVLDGDVVAFDMCLLHGRRLCLLKLGYDERFRRLSPGLVLQLSIIERCFELGLEAFELHGDEAEWKRKFSTAERRHVCLRAYSRSPRPSLDFAYRRFARPLLRRGYHRARALRGSA